MTYVIAVLICVLALTFAFWNYVCIQRIPEGTGKMSEMAGIIRSGANTFMETEYRTIVPVVLIVAGVFTLLIEVLSGVTFLVGALMSSLACIFGMKGATYANVRTTAVAARTHSIGRAVKVALCGGSISGLSVQAFGLIGLVLILIIFGIDINATGGGLIKVLECNPTIMRLTTYSLGCSIVAMFNRVAGGNYTKAADISADIVGKNRHDLPEDDCRIPNTIADFIGDNVNDVAGNCSDLCESFVATVIAGILISASIVARNNGSAELFKATCSYPIIIASSGLFGSVIGIFYAMFGKDHTGGDNPSKQLNVATYLSAGITMLLSGIASYMLFGNTELYSEFVLGWASPFVSSLFGIASGIAVGKITEYYTATEHRPVQDLARIAPEGDAFVVTKGDAIGSRSCLLPILVIALSLVISGFLCGIYGIAIASLGMLSFVATTVSIDAFGPIADNAGGIAESCHLDASVRAITDKLDAVGNTTAAIGKGFAIGSAAFATVSLIFAYVGSYSNAVVPMLNIASFIVIAGAIVGGGLIEYFSAMLTDNTIESARKMADEGDKQLSIPGVLEGTKKPNYNKLIELAANQALKKMLLPSVIALIVPAIGGLLFGPEFVGGLLIGATITAIPRAIFMGNSGGAFDNAKKYIEEGLLKGYGKGSNAHKSAVTGDTIGDTRKDVVGVALDIFIKSMSTVANTLAPLFSTYHLF